MNIEVFDRTYDRVQRSSNLSANDGQKSATDVARIDGLVPLEMAPDEARLFNEENRTAGLNLVLAEQDWPILSQVNLKMLGLFIALEAAEKELKASLA